ncbi:MAG: arginine--tRNA ligase [Candidatus Makana argininalis]
MNINMLISKKIKNVFLFFGLKNIYSININKTNIEKFGNYQLNFIIFISKKFGIDSIILAKKLIYFIKLNGIVDKIDIIYPGFMNFFINIKFIKNLILDYIKSNRIGIKKLKFKNIVIDYSSPNIAKEMHVGHLRSTIIGDAYYRIILFLGLNAIKANHIGDWGAQFGMLIAYIVKKKIKKSEIKISCLENYYCLAKIIYKKDPYFCKLSKKYLVKLQNRDQFCIKLWKKILLNSIKKNQIIYDKLNVTLNYNDIYGESFYHNLLPNIINDLIKKKIALNNNGNIIIFLNEFKNKYGNKMGVIIKKKDGSYLYSAIDIACAKYRCEILKANKIIYFVDSRQNQYLLQIFKIVKKAGYVPKNVYMKHYMFGMILNKNGKPFKTRDGSNIKLIKLLNESILRAKIIIKNKNPNIKTKELYKLAKIVGIGSIKYNDLSRNRVHNYIFNWNNMLNFNGNTYIYIQYAYARISSIIERNCKNKKILIYSINIKKKYEIKLANKLIQLEEILFLIYKKATPNILCSYLYDVSVIFSSFYEKYSIINSKNFKTINSRLKLILLTRKTLKLGLNLLGIKISNKM